MKTTLLIILSLFTYTTCLCQSEPVITATKDTELWAQWSMGYPVNVSGPMDKGWSNGYGLGLRAFVSQGVSLNVDAAIVQTDVEVRDVYSYTVSGWTWIFPNVEERLVRRGWSKSVTSCLLTPSVGFRTSRTALFALEMVMGYTIPLGLDNKTSIGSTIHLAGGIRLQPEGRFRARVEAGVLNGAIGFNVAMGLLL